VPTYTGTSGNDSWTVINPGTFTLDGLGGADTLYLGTSLRSDYIITKSGDGAVHIDSVSGASAKLHATLFNMETLVFNNKRDTLDLTTYFGDSAPPTVTITDNAPGTATGNITYALAFSENVTGLTASDFTVANGSVVSVTGNGASYSVVVAPNAGTEGTLTLTLKAASVTDAAGNANAAAASAAAQPIDTKAPTVASTTPSVSATGVAVGADIVVTFSEAIQRGAGSIVLRDASGKAVASWDAATSANLSLSGQVLTLNPSADLAAGTGYRIEFPAGSLKDLAGNAWAGSSALQFTTAGQAVQSFIGTAANDTFNVPAGASTADGLGGIDRLVFTQARSAYTVKSTSTGFVVNANDGSSTIDFSHIERLQFSDTKLALDLNGNAGAVAKVLGAVFGAGAVAQADYVGIGLQLADSGSSYAGLMQLALDARLGAGASHKAVVGLLWGNIVGGTPSASDEAYYVSLLDSNALTPAALGVLAADTDFNLQRIDLVGLSQSGLAYTGG